MLSSQITQAQITVNANYTPQQLAEDVLIGAGVDISNIQYAGNAQARGYFEAAGSGFPLDQGVILSTGRVQNAVGPNNGASPGGDDGTDFGASGDAELTAISGVSTLDASILEFDFTPQSDTIQFRYVFASNEYGFWEGQGFTDVFAFLISGPGIVGEQNIALIPNTNVPVTIDDLNSTSNAQYYVNNEN
ncbi:MAG: choice-of-anchor L domain-containing protein, partial [Flavobacteriales bacterium]